MNDPIDRQAAIDAIENTDVELSSHDWDVLTDAIMNLTSAMSEPITINFAREADAEMSEKIRKTLKDAPILLMAFEPEQKEGKWIPCNERLPEEEDMYQRPKHRYLCQHRVPDNMIVCSRLRNLGSPMAAFWDWYGREVRDKDIIAWMPLPKPYKEQEG